MCISTVSEYFCGLCSAVKTPLWLKALMALPDRARPIERLCRCAGLKSMDIGAVRTDRVQPGFGIAASQELDEA